MTPSELIEIAKRKGAIRWLKSGIHESITINKAGFVIAYTTKGPLSLRLTANYACEEAVTNIVEKRS
jgi:hypothetical protein